MRTLTVFRKTISDVSAPKLFAAYFVPFFAVIGFFAMIVGQNSVSEESTTLLQQEVNLHAAFAFTSVYLVVGIFLLTLTAVLATLTVSREAEAGTFQLLLSKPLKRWQYWAGTYAAVLVYGTLVGLASLLLMAVMLVEFSDVEAAVISGAIFDQLLGTLVFVLFGVGVVTAVGFALGVTTKDRLRTGLGTLVVPILYLVFFPIRMLAGGRYEDYMLYVVDVTYHFGNVFVFVHELFGDLPLQTQQDLSIWTGVYEPGTADSELQTASLDLAGHVPMEVSVLLLGGIGVGAFVLGLSRFRSMDV